jgi:VanZ family protein
MASGTASSPAHGARRFRRACLALSGAIAIAIFMVCLLPGEDLPQTNIWDKAEHFIAYVALSAPLAIGLGRGKLLPAFVMATLFGGFIEMAQGAAPTGRSASWLDAVANMIGAGLGTAAAAVLRRIKRV